MRVELELGVIWSVQMYAGLRPLSGPEPAVPPKRPPPSGRPMSAGHEVALGCHGERSPMSMRADMSAMSVEATPPSVPPLDGPPEVRSRRDRTPLSHVE